MEDFTNMNPQTNREWLQYISRQLDDIKESANEDREIVADYMAKTDSWIKCHDDEYKAHVSLNTTYYERVDHINTSVKGWNVINSIGVVLAAILGYLGLR